MSFWTLDSLRAACSGKLVSRPVDPHTARIDGFSIDSRSIKPGQVFLALRGERFDGHEFLAKAASAGAPLLIVDRPESVPRAGFPTASVLLVPDTRKALLRLAAAYRKRLEATRVIAVCGSNGKTTTTRLIHAILSVRLRGSCPAKSFNNDIGVPLTILAAKEADQFLICEVGSNAPGEIALLAGVVQPDIAVITSIGREHLERLGSLEGVAREEASILQEIRPSGAAIVTADTPLLADSLRVLAASGRTVVTFGKDDKADLRLTTFEHFISDDARPAPGGSPSAADSIRFSVNARATFTAPLVGEHNALNALAAIGVARRLGLTDRDIAAGLAGAVGPDMRLQRTSIAGITLINDAYNANPDSTLAALRTFAALYSAADRRVVVLGDNLELGEAGPEAHHEIGQAILALRSIDHVVCVGPLAALAGQVLEADLGPDRLTRIPDLSEGRDRQIAALLRPADAVLLKGSRRMGLEQIVAALQSTTPPTPTTRSHEPRRTSTRA